MPSPLQNAKFKQVTICTTTAWTDHVINAMAIDNLLDYARLYLNNEMQIFIDAEESLDI